MSTPGIAGWYGKTASLGDFASRRLPSSFISPWDAWLQHAMTTSRSQLGAGWLDAYLGCPLWRFVLFPGICGSATWAGVLMPSVDRVGRYFPFTIACELDSFATTEREFDLHSDWLARLERLALSTLDTACDMQHFDRALAALQAPATATPRVGFARAILEALLDGRSTTLTLPSDGELSSTLMAAGATLLAGAARESSLWWTTGEPGSGVPVLACRGLPDAARFAAMLQGHSPAPA
jgi:type VI secretion system protein ImpM